MKKAAVSLFLCSTSVWPQPTFNELPAPDCRLVTLGNRTVIQDARGFFVGYYVARPTSTVPAYVPDRKPEGLYTGKDGTWSSVFSQPYMPPMPTTPAPPGWYWEAKLDGKRYTWVLMVYSRSWSWD